MRSSTKSSNGNNSDNMNNNTIEVDEGDKRSADDVIDIACTEETKLHNQTGNCESENVDNDKSATVNVYEQVNLLYFNYTLIKLLIHIC